MNARQVAHETYAKIDRLADHAVLKMISRLAMALFIPILLFLANDYWTSRDVLIRTANTLAILEKRLDERREVQLLRDRMQDADRDRLCNRMTDFEKRFFRP